MLSILLAACLCGAGVCETTINIADWFGHRKGNIELDTRNGGDEVGWHTPEGSWVEVPFLEVPTGTHPRILKTGVDIYSIFTGRGWSRSPQQAVALHAIHSKNSYDFGQVGLDNCTDCLLWLQTPVGRERWVERDVSRLPAGLLTQDKLWMKLALFANLGGDEVLSEMTASFEFCYEPIK